MNYLLLVVMTVLGSVASFFLKKASSGSGILSIIRAPHIYIGGVLYFSSALLNIVILRELDYSIVLPLTSITYVWTMFISYFFLKEHITKKKVIGVILIVIGALFVAK